MPLTFWARKKFHIKLKWSHKHHYKILRKLYLANDETWETKRDKETQRQRKRVRAFKLFATPFAVFVENFIFEIQLWIVVKLEFTTGCALYLCQRDDTNKMSMKIQSSFCKYTRPFILNVCNDAMACVRSTLAVHIRAMPLRLANESFFFFVSVQKCTWIYFIFIVIWCSRFVGRHIAHCHTVHLISLPAMQNIGQKKLSKFWQ